MFNYPKTTIAIILFLALVLYGFYEKERRKNLYNHYYADKILDCDGTSVRLSDGWIIHNNRFFTNGKVFKTIVYCRSVEE